jgi:hypothetical protein
MKIKEIKNIEVLNQKTVSSENPISPLETGTLVSFREQTQ